MFGGVSSDNAPVPQELYLLKLWQKPLIFKKVETKGQRPEPRIDHTMHYLRASQLLAVIGGRHSHFRHQFIDSVFLLKLGSMTWTQIDVSHCFLTFRIPSPLYGRGQATAVRALKKIRQFTFWGGLIALDFFPQKFLSIPYKSYKVSILMRYSFL